MNNSFCPLGKRSQFLTQHPVSANGYVIQALDLNPIFYFLILSRKSSPDKVLLHLKLIALSKLFGQSYPCLQRPSDDFQGRSLFPIFRSHNLNNTPLSWNSSPASEDGPFLRTLAQASKVHYP